MQVPVIYSPIGCHLNAVQSLVKILPSSKQTPWANFQADQLWWWRWSNIQGRSWLWIASHAFNIKAIALCKPLSSVSNCFCGEKSLFLGVLRCWRDDCSYSRLKQCDHVSRPKSSFFVIGRKSKKKENGFGSPLCNPSIFMVLFSQDMAVKPEVYLSWFLNNVLLFDNQNHFPFPTGRKHS